MIGRGNLLTSISFPSQDSGTLTAVMAVLCEWNGTDPQGGRGPLGARSVWAAGFTISIPRSRAWRRARPRDAKPRLEVSASKTCDSCARFNRVGADIEHRTPPAF